MLCWFDYGVGCNVMVVAHMKVSIFQTVVQKSQLSMYRTHESYYAYFKVVLLSVVK